MSAQQNQNTVSENNGGAVNFNWELIKASLNQSLRDAKVMIHNPQKFYTEILDSKSVQDVVIFAAAGALVNGLFLAFAAHDFQLVIGSIVNSIGGVILGTAYLYVMAGVIYKSKLNVKQIALWFAFLGSLSQAVSGVTVIAPSSAVSVVSLGLAAFSGYLFYQGLIFYAKLQQKEALITLCIPVVLAAVSMVATYFMVAPKF